MIEMLRDLVLHKGYANATLLGVVAQSPALRRHGATVPMTDFIMWIVDRPVVPWPSPHQT